VGVWVGVCVHTKNLRLGHACAAMLSSFRDMCVCVCVCIYIHTQKPETETCVLLSLGNLIL